MNKKAGSESSRQSQKWTQLAHWLNRSHFFQRYGASAALTVPCQWIFGSYPHSSDGGCKPNRLMARHTIVTNPTANRGMIAMIHLKRSPFTDRQLLSGAAVRKGIYFGLPQYCVQPY
ncbi:MAG: hypothetical protein J7K66_02170 [Anaerolineaceae bacterium]|nr:hypothetical protein [Anaerolineaceae bacterium]